jgi:hypothetical protein
MFTNSDIVPTMGLAEENVQLRRKVLLYELGFTALHEFEVATAFMMADQSIDDMDAAEAAWDELTSMDKRRYIKQAGKFSAAVRIVQADHEK